MTIQPNGTHAKEIALHFLEVTHQKPTRNSMAHTINIAKELLTEHSKDDILRVINNVVETKQIRIYSLGYIKSSIDEVLGEMRAAEQAVQIRIDSANAIAQQRHEVKIDDSTKRNREKFERTKLQPRLGKKFNFDMFEGK